MKEKNKLILYIVIVLLLIVLVGGGTFAYWTWITDTNQQTNVSFTVSQESLEGQLYANMDGGGTTEVSKLAPVDSCLNETYVMKKTVTLNYMNATTNEATITGTLTLSDFNSPYGEPKATDLGHIHYAVTSDPDSCSLPIEGASGVFTSTSGNLFTDVNLLETSIPAGTEEEQSKTLTVWVWIDKEYKYQNVGNSVTDPLQDITFNLTWSGNVSNDN